MKPIYFYLDDKDIDKIIRDHYEKRGFKYGGSQRDGKSPCLNIQVYVEDLTKIGGGEAE